MLNIDTIVSLSLDKQNIFLLIANNNIYEIFVEDILLPDIGDVYYGIVREKAKTERAFFVEYEKEKYGYLKSSQKHFVGEKVLVMIKKTGAGKKPELTEDISITGNFVIYKPFEKHLVAVSKKADKALKKQFKDFFMQKISLNEGVIIRSSSKNTTISNVFDEFLNLRNQTELFKKEKTLLKCLYKKSNFFEELVANNALSLSKIITNDVFNFNKIKKFCSKNLLELTNKITKLKNNEIFNEYDIQETLEDIFSTTTNIIPHGKLSIIQTPALVAIDVDSGSGKDDKDFLNSWIYETVRQIKLRNLSGKIVIDPPFLPTKEQFKEILSIFKNCLKIDTVNSYVAGISPLGNVEISRERISPPIIEKLEKIKSSLY